MNGPAEQPVWERPWTLEEIRRSGQSWSLGADAGLLNFLREFSQQTISRTHDIEKQLDGLIRDAKATDCRLHNVFNDFLMLSNTQFIENRVYDEEIEEHVVKSDPGDKPEQEKTREQKEAELIPKVQEAVSYGLRVLESAFEQLDIKAGNSDSEEEEVNERVELILEPKDLYLDRHLPYLIGSQLFMQQEDVGLGDLSSEEGSIDNDRGSIIDSEEDDEDEKDEESDFDNNSEEEEEKKLRSALSDEDEDNGSDLFGDSDKEEDEENEKSTKTKTKSFADELAARIQGGTSKKPETDQTSVSSLEVKVKKEKEKREVKNLPSEDEEDDDDDYIFKPPKLTDEDFSPFGSKGGLFSGGKGLFDDDEEGDLFTDVPNKENQHKEAKPVVSSEPKPPNVKKKPPVGGVSLFPGGENVLGSSILADKEKREATSPAVETSSKQPTGTSLFDDEDGLFGSDKQAVAKPIKVKTATDLFADEADLFEDSLSSLPPTASNKAKDPEGSKQKSKDVMNVQLHAEKPTPPEPLTKKHTRGLFSDEDDSEDLFVPVPERKSLSVSVKPTPQKPLLVELKNEKPGLFSSDEEDPVSALKQAVGVKQNLISKDKAFEHTAKKENSVMKSSLFDEEEEDLFAITKDSQKKNNRVSLLFEEDNNSSGTLFSSDVTQPIPAGSMSEQFKPSGVVKSSHHDEKDSLFGKTGSNLEGEKEDSKAPHKEPPPVPKKEIKQIVASDPGDYENEDLFAVSPPTDKHPKFKSQNVLSLFEDEEDTSEDHLQINNTYNESRKTTSGKSTGVFQDEELLFSDELQKDNDPDVDLFASTKKQSSEKEKSSQAKRSLGVGLFGEEDEEDIFSTTQDKTPPKVQERKSVVKNVTPDPSKDTGKVPEVVPDPLKKTHVKAEDDGHPTGPAPVKAKSATSRIGKIQANLHINPATMLPGAVPKLSGIRPTAPWQEYPTPAYKDVSNSTTLPTESQSADEGVSFENPAQIDTLHSANKTSAKVADKRRPPTRVGRRLASQDSETEDFHEPLFTSLATNANVADAVPSQSNQGLERNGNVSTMKLSVSENDVQSKTNTKIATKPLTPDVNDLFDSDLFSKSVLPTKATNLKGIEASSDCTVTGKTVQEITKKSPALMLDDEGSDEDLFHAVKQKSKRAPKPSALIPAAQDDLFGTQKPQMNDSQPAASDIFEHDIFATEAVKPVKKPKGKKTAPETNLFDDNLDIFADLTQKPKEKKTKKKVEPKSIFDDDMDDIFSSRNQKKSKPKVGASQPTTETKSDHKATSSFDDPLNVLGK